MPPAAARYFEYRKGTSNKFWEIWVDGTTVKTRYGKIGVAGKTTARKTAGRPAANGLLEKLVGEKLRKGYQGMRAGAPAARSAKSTTTTRAEIIGSLHAQSASLWFLAIDATDAAAWKGDDGHDYEDESPRANKASDFGRAMTASPRKPMLAVGKAEGAIVRVGGGGSSPIWSIPGGIALLDYALGEDIDDRSKQTAQTLSAAVIELPAKGAPQAAGRITVRSGVLAVLLPAERGDFTPAQVKKAAAGTKAIAANPSRALVPVPNGTYQVFLDRLDRDDDFGLIERRVRIVRTKNGPA